MLLGLTIIFGSCRGVSDQQEKSLPKLILVTLDGYRWQELFHGVDSVLINSEFNSEKDQLTSNFWTNDPAERTRKLNPFFYEIVQEQGVLIGNRNENSLMDCRNKLWFSYPGYNEILTGRADDERIQSNDKEPNPNITFLETLNQSEDYRGKVAAFCSWDVFPFIINEERSSVYVSAGFDSAGFQDITRNEGLLNRIQSQTSGPWGTVRLDVFTHNFALEYMKQRKPAVVYIAYGETDDFAHDGDYDHYIRSAKLTNTFLTEIWEMVQTDEYYRDQTTMIITTDHGRGTVPIETWRGHGGSVEGAGEIFLAAIGPGIKSSGLIEGQFYQDQVAATSMKLLGYDWENGDPILEILR